MLSLSFANVKENTYAKAKIQIFQILSDLYVKRQYLKVSGLLIEQEQKYFDRVSEQMTETDASICLHKLCDFMQRYYDKKVIILLDEYDTPMQDAWLSGYWEETVIFFSNLFNSTFKTNEYLERGLITGITRIAKESIFTGMNNLDVITTTSNEYATSQHFSLNIF